MIQFSFSQDGFIDPYSTYLDVTVSLSNEFENCNWIKNRERAGGLMLDGPSTSLFSEFIMESNEKTLEHIKEHD